MASLIQPYVDKENPGGVTAGKRGRLLSAGPRPGVGKVFANNDSSLVTPRKALGNLSNTVNKPAGSSLMKKPLAPHLKTPGLGMRKVFDENSSVKGVESKKKAPRVRPDVLKSVTTIHRPTESYPDIEKMNVFQDKEPSFDKLPAEDSLTSYLDKLGAMRTTLFRYPLRDVEDFTPDFSHLTLETNLRPAPSDEPILPSGGDSIGCFDLPPVDAIDFLDINSLRFDDF